MIPLLEKYFERKEFIVEELDVYKEQFEQVIDIIESAKERAYRKVNEELILIERLYSDNELKSGIKDK